MRSRGMAFLAWHITGQRGPWGRAEGNGILEF